MNLLFKLLDPRSIIAQFTLYAGGGGSTPAATSQTNTVSSIAPWAQPGVEQLISTGLQNAYPNYNPSTGQLGAQNGYTPFDPTNTSNPAMMQAYSAGQNTTAGFSPLQQQSFNTAANMQVPGQYNAATGLNTQAGYGALGTTGQANMYGQMGAMAGNSYGMNAQNVNGMPSSTVQNYMNPYLQNTLQPSLQLLNQQYGMQNAANNAQATQAGAFGGSRMGVQNALTNQAQNLATNQLVGNAYNQAYNTANTNMQTAANLGIQGAQAGLAGIGAQQAGYNSAGAAGSNLSNIGTAQLGAQQSVAGLQNAYGAQQQQQQQNVLNAGAQNYSTMQAYPMQQLQQLEGLYTGAPTNTTTQNYQAAPSTVSQVAGLGMAGYGLSQLGSGSNPQSATPAAKAKGGRIKEFGIDKLSAKNLESFKEGGITGGRMEDGTRRFDIAGSVKTTAPTNSDDSGLFTAADYSLGTQDPRLYRDSTLNTAQKFNPTQLQLLQQNPSSGTNFTGYPNANSGAVLGGQQYPKLSQNVLAQFLQAQQNLPDASPAANSNTSMDNLAAAGANTASTETPPTPYKPPQVGLPSLLSTNSMTPEQAKQASLQFYNPADSQKAWEQEKADLQQDILNNKAARQEMYKNRPVLGKKQEELLDKAEAKDDKKLSDLRASSWLEAGLAVLGGTSPNGLINLSNAKEGLKSYKEGLKDLDKAKDVRDQARGHIEDMRNAQLIGDQNAEQTANENFSDKLHTYNMHLLNAHDNMSGVSAGISSGIFGRSQDTAAANARANLGAATEVTKTNALLQQPPEQIRSALYLGNGDALKGINILQEAMRDKTGVGLVTALEGINTKREAAMQPAITMQQLLDEIKQYQSSSGLGSLPTGQPNATAPRSASTSWGKFQQVTGP